VLKRNVLPIVFGLMGVLFVIVGFCIIRSTPEKLADDTVATGSCLILLGLFLLVFASFLVRYQERVRATRHKLMHDIVDVLEGAWPSPWTTAEIAKYIPGSNTDQVEVFLRRLEGRKIISVFTFESVDSWILGLPFDKCTPVVNYDDIIALSSL
jgi:hypothetical protein